MTAPVGEGAQSGAEGTQSGTGENAPGNTGTPNTTTGDGTQSGTETPPEATVPKAEADALRERMKAADQRAATFEAKLKQLVDKDLPEQEKLKRDYEETTKQVEALRTTNSKLSLEVAFLKDNTYKWKNPARALQVVDLSQVEINDDGSVSGLKDALKALATSDPYMLETENPAGGTTPPPTAPGNNGGSSAARPSTKGMAARIPALKTRVKRS